MGPKNGSTSCSQVKDLWSIVTVCPSFRRFRLCDQTAPFAVFHLYNQFRRRIQSVRQYEEDHKRIEGSKYKFCSLHWYSELLVVWFRSWKWMYGPCGHPFDPQCDRRPPPVLATNRYHFSAFQSYVTTIQAHSQLAGRQLVF